MSYTTGTNAPDGGGHGSNGQSQYQTDREPGLPLGGQAPQAGIDPAGTPAGTREGAPYQQEGEDLRGRGASLASDAGAKLSDTANAHKQNAADSLKRTADALHRSGEQLEGEQDTIARLVERGADELGALADTLRNNDFRGLVGTLGNMARRQPALFIGATMAAGFALARVGRLAAGSKAGATDRTTWNGNTEHPAYVDAGGKL
jgi:hypothetical protein